MANNDKTVSLLSKLPEDVFKIVLMLCSYYERGTDIFIIIRWYEVGPVNPDYEMMYSYDDTEINSCIKCEIDVKYDYSAFWLLQA